MTYNHIRNLQVTYKMMKVPDLLRMLSAESNISRKLKNNTGTEKSVSEHCATFKTTFFFQKILNILNRILEKKYIIKLKYLKT